MRHDFHSQYNVRNLKQPLFDLNESLTDRRPIWKNSHEFTRQRDGPVQHTMFLLYAGDGQVHASSGCIDV